MEYMIAKGWHEYNRSERIKDLMAALGCFGQGKADYLRGRPFLLRTLLGRGCPNPVDESKKWNQVAITYRGKDVIHIFDSAVCKKDQRRRNLLLVHHRDIGKLGVE